MRYLFGILVLIIASASSQGQSINNSDIERKTLLSNKPLTGGAISFTGKGGEISSQESLWLGGEVFTVFKHNLHIGLAGYGLVNSINSINTDENDKQLYYQSGYGGLFLEPAILENIILNISFPVLLGAGGIAESRFKGVIDELEDFDNFDIEGNDFYNSDLFWVVEPGVAVNLNVSRWMKITAGMSYRYTHGLELPQTSSNLLNGINGNVGLKLGWF